ncbi:glycosyltransferase family 39 protein [Patescibacteria group bacterium]|nr:glycosyltransferase family 39 protein [Patescibacteria group bacterium]
MAERKTSIFWFLVLLVSLLIGAFLRFYRLPENVVFHGELGHNYLAIKNAFESGTIPLLGPPTSHPWLSFGPLFYWLFGPILALFNFNPVVGAYFFAFVGTALILLNFIVIKEFFGERVAAISSFLISFSYAWVNLTRESRFFSLSAFFFYPFLYFLLRHRLFWAGLFLGVMFNFHLSPIVLLVPTAIYLFVNKRAFNKNSIFHGIVGFIIPNIPFLIYNSQHKFVMLVNLLTWVPYRIAGFLGIYPKNTATAGVLKANVVSLYDFVGNMFAPNYRLLSFVMLVIILSFAAIKFSEEIKKTTKNWPILILILFFLFGYLGIFVHGDPPSHYYLPIYPLPIIFFSVFMAEAAESRIIKYISILVLAGFLTINLNFYFSNKWFEGAPVPYSMQLSATQSIISDAKGKRFVLHRVGPFDYFEGDYAQNYRYLLWLEGNEPVDNAIIKYTIYEGKLSDKSSGTIVYQKDGLAVLKEQNEK